MMIEFVFGMFCWWFHLSPNQKEKIEDGHFVKCHKCGGEWHNDKTL